MKTVLVFRADLLPYSETFIREQVQSYRRWQSVLSGIKMVPGLQLDALNVCVLRGQNSGIIDKIRWRLLPFGFRPSNAARKLRDLRPALVHVHFGVDAALCYPFLRCLDCPIIITLHGYDITISRKVWETRPDFASRAYPRRLLDLAKKPDISFIAVSENIREAAIRFGIPRERIDVKYIGVDTSFFAPGPPLSNRPLQIVYTGRMAEKKGPQFLIEAFVKVRAQMPAAELVMIGDGPLLQVCRAVAERLGAPVDFKGSLTKEQVREHLDTARVFCLPSITAINGDTEGLPIAIIEAQACGIPVVTSAKGGAQEGILDGVTGFSFAEKDVDAMAAHILRLLKDENLLVSMGHEARRFVLSRFDINRCTAFLEDHYDIALNNANARRG